MQAVVADALVPLGLRRRKAGFLTCELNSDCLGWVSLGSAAKATPHVRRIWPKVGVRHQQAERIVFQLRSRAAHQYLPPTVSIGLGYIGPADRWIEWSFAEGHDWSGQSREVREAVAAKGLPWMHQRASLATLLEAATSEKLALYEQFTVPVLLQLSGARGEARQALERYVDELGSRSDQAAAEYRLFAVAFGTWKGSVV